MVGGLALGVFFLIPTKKDLVDGAWLIAICSFV